MAALFGKTYKAKLKTLENELMTSIQWRISVSQYFTKAKSISSEIVELAPDEMPSEAILRRIRINSLNPKYNCNTLYSNPYPIPK